jgi:CRP-like cAMP-binding protein
MTYNGYPAVPDAIAELLEPIERRRGELEAQRAALMAQVEPIDVELKTLARIERAAIPPTSRPGPKPRGTRHQVGPESLERVRAALLAMDGDVTFTVQQVAGRTGLTDGTTREALERLRQEEVVRMIGRFRPEGHKGPKPVGYKLVRGD